MKKQLTRGQLYRNIHHLSLLFLMTLSVLIIGRWQTVRWVVICTAIALMGEYLRISSSAFEGFIRRYLGFMMRPNELARSDKLKFNGATWAFLSALITFSLFPTYASVPAFTVLALADPAASIFGRTYGRTRIFAAKTLEGSIAFFAVAFVLLFALTNLTPLGTLLAALVATAAELMEFGLNDNIRVPLATAMILIIL